MTSDAQEPSSRNDPGRAEEMSLGGVLDYHTIFDAASNAMALTESSSGRIVEVNAAWIRATGIVPERAVGRTAFELGLWANRAEREACLAELEAKGRVGDFEARLVMKSAELPHLLSGEVVEMGGKRYVLWEFRDIAEQERMTQAMVENEAKVKSLLAASEQSRRALLGILEDEKRAREALRESQSRIASISNNLTDGMIYQVVIERDGTRRFTYLSDSVRRLYGVSPEEGMANAALIYSRIHEDDVKPLSNAEDEAVRTHSTFRAEARMKDPSGAIRWSSFVSTPTRMEDGSTCFDGMEFVVTERKRVEEALRESEKRLRDITFSMADWVWEVDKNGVYTYSSEKGFDLFGPSRDDVIGKTPFDFMPPDEAKRVAPIFSEIAANKAPIKDLENWNISRNGERICLLTNGVPVLDEAGNLKGYRGVDKDITERKRVEEEKEKLQAQLLQAQKMESVGRLAGGVAHDFNNMLGVILGHAEMAMDGMDPAHPLLGDLVEIRKAAQRSAELTQRLLAFARRQTIAPKALDLNETIEGMLKMLRRLIGADINLAWRPGAGLWPVKMDPSQIDQILANLCVNARDAISGVGKVTIETDNATFDEAYCAYHPGVVPGGYVVLAVSDNGCGMDKETVEKVFEPFFTTKEVGKGTGLGLAIVYGIVKQNNGLVNVYSEPGQGTTFMIYLPRHATQAEEIAREDSPKPVARGHETILLAEDEATILTMATRMLERLGYTVLAANTPVEAIRLAREHAGEIHLLMTDVIMPEMNGRDLAKSLIALYPNLKQLFMSGYTANVIAHHGVLDPGVAFIQKPFSLPDLAAKVREALGKV